MRLLLSSGCAIAFLYLLTPARGGEAKPDALPSGVVARLGWSPLRIGDADFALTLDGRSIVVVTPQGNLRRLDAHTGRLLERRQLTDRSDVDPTGGSEVQLWANGQIVAIEDCSYTGPRVTVYDVASGKQIFRRASSDKRHVLWMTLSPDGERLAVVEWPVGGGKRSLRVFDLKSGRSRDMGTWERVQIGLDFSGDGKRLLVSEPFPQGTDSHAGSSTLVLFDATSGKELWRRKMAAITNRAISQDGKTVLASGYRDPTGTESGFHVLKMDGAAAKPTERFLLCHRRSENSMGVPVFTTFLLAPDNRTIVVRDFDDVYLWDVQISKEIRHLTLFRGSQDNLSTFRMAISAESRTLLTNVGHLQRWDLKTGKPFFQSPPEDSLPDFPTQLAVTPDGKEIVGSSNRWLLGRWDIATGKRTNLRRDAYGGSQLFRTSDGVRAIRSNVQVEQGEFTVFDPLAHKSLHVIRWTAPKEIGAPVARASTLTANGKTLLAIYEGKRHWQAAAWDVATGRKLSDFAVGTDYDLAKSPFSPCGRWVLLHDKSHHVGSGKELFEPRGRPGESLNYGDMNRVWFSEDGRLMAASLGTVEKQWPRNHTLAVWELASGQVLARFPKPGFVAQAAFAPDDRTIALLNAQGVRLMDLLSGKELAKHPAPDVVCDTDAPGPVTQGLVFAPDGSTLATAHLDGSILLWKVPRSGNAAPAALADGEAEKLWKDLGSSSASKARAAVELLACHPDAAMSLLAARFRPPPADGKHVKLINDLDSDEFARREEASRKLRAYGPRVEPALRRTLAKAPSLEMRRRIEGILAEMAPPALRLPLTGERLRGVRAIEVLERIGNAAARKLLDSWAEQTEDVHLAIEARLALERLGPAGPRARQKRQEP